MNCLRAALLGYMRCTAQVQSISILDCRPRLFDQFWFLHFEIREKVELALIETPAGSVSPAFLTCTDWSFSTEGGVGPSFLYDLWGLKNVWRYLKLGYFVNINTFYYYNNYLYDL